MTKNLLLSAAIAGLISASLTVAAQAKDEGAAKETEKCYGVAHAGKNDCANAAGTHSCAGQATVDKDAGDFVNVEKGKCAGQGGTTEPAKK